MHGREVVVFGRVWTRFAFAFSVQVLGPVSSPLGVSDLSLRHPVGEGFFCRVLRPDLGVVWLF